MTKTWEAHYRDIPWSKLVLQARKRHLDDLQKINDPDFPYYFDYDAADWAVEFIGYLRHVDGEWFGRPFDLADWQEYDIVRPLFGWKRKKDGTRRYRTAYIEIARKNGKSALAAAMSALLFLADKEPGAQVYTAATKEDQAKIVWDMARKMMSNSPELSDFITVYKKLIECKNLDAVFRPLGRDSKSLDGLSTHGGVVDEFHAHKTSEIYDVLSSSRGARRQPLIVIITTAGFGTATPCKQESDTAKKILDGTIKNDEYFAFIATVDDPEKWTDLNEWIKANPNWGISLYEDGFLSEFKEAEMSSRKQNAFKCKKLNIWTEQATRWINMRKYKQCDREIILEDLKHRRCYGGLDLGITQDISAFALAFQGDVKPDGGPPDITLLMKYWVPEDNIADRKRFDGVDYPTWVNEGWITTTPGSTTRYDKVRKDINALTNLYDIQEIAVDRAHAHELMTNLADDGHTIIKHPQTAMAMNFPCRTLEELILDKRLIHGNDPVLEWMISNVSIIIDGNENIKVVKDKSGDRVDGVVAAVMAIGRLLIAPEPVNNVYNSRGVFIG